VIRAEAKDEWRESTPRWSQSEEMSRPELARLPAAHPYKVGIRMIANCFSFRRFLFRLLFGHSLVDALKYLPFGQARVFQPSDRRGTERRKPLQIALKNKLNRRIRETNQAQHDSVTTDRVELVGTRETQNVGLRITRSQQAGHGFGTRKQAIMRMRRRNQRDASVVADPAVFQLDDLLYLRIGDIERLELLDGCRPHASLIERTVIRQRVLVAPTRQEQRNAKNEVSGLHISIVGAASATAPWCAVGDTRQKDRWQNNVTSKVDL